MFGVGWGANQFSSLLLAYRLHRGVSESTADALFGVYALGLIPALLMIGAVQGALGHRVAIKLIGKLPEDRAAERQVAQVSLERRKAGHCRTA
jgi:hypothetical protein